MILIIPLSFLLLLNVLLNSGLSLRTAIINAYLIFSFQIFIITEFLSFTDSLNTNTVFALHLIVTIFYFFYRSEIKLIKISFIPKLDSIFFFKIIIVFILLVTFITAIYSPPNNWDSNTYHMPRVSHWIQNSNVNFFTTNNYRQNSLAPFSEFVILNLQILSNSDLFSNLVQWFSFCVSIITISLISKEFGLKQNLQIISAFFISTLPLAILHTSNTKNDLVLCSFILLFYYYQLCSLKKFSFKNIILSGIALGLCILTKGTSYIFLFSIGIVFFIYSISISNYDKRIKIIYKTISIVSIGFTINLPHYIRCYLKYNNLFGGNELIEVVKNDNFSFFIIFSNLIRLVAYQLGSTINIVNWYIYRFVQVLLGNSISDPSTSLLGMNFRPPFFSIHEDHAGNIIHTLFIILLCFISFMIIKNVNKLQLTSLWISTLSIILYCFLFKWQPYTGKTIPLFIIISPFIVIIMNNIIKYEKIKIIIHLVLITMFLTSFPYLFYNKSRPILPLGGDSIIYQDRMMGYFVNQPKLYNQYKKIVNEININKNDSVFEESIGLLIGGDSWEYPFWVMLKERFHNKVPYVFHLTKDSIYILTEEKKQPKYLIFENRFLDNYEEIRKSYVTIVSVDNFSLLKKIMI